MVDLHPSGTVAVCDTMSPPAAGHWVPNIPIHLTTDRLNYWRDRIAERIMPKAFVERSHSTAGFLRKHGVDVLMGEYLDASLPYLKLCGQLGIPFFVHAHGQDITGRLRDARFRKAYASYANAEGIISMSQRGKEILAGLGLPEEKIHVVPYGVDVPPHPPQRAVRDMVLCVAVGRMTAIKSPMLLLDSFRRAFAQCRNLRLNYIGGGELLDAARNYVKSNGLEQQVELSGPQPHDQVRRALESADIFLQHSVRDPATGDTEGLPVAILEAMAHGLPVISTRHAGIPEEVEEGVTGLLVEENDAQGMAEAIVRVASDTKWRLEMGAAGHRRAHANFTWEREARELRRVLKLN
jgi:glycosyltransferase involved in cell wall biosynthesis